MHILVKEPEGKGHIELFDKNITNFNIETEEGKGYSNARFQITTVNIDNRTIHNINARNEVIAFVEGDVVWKGRIEAIQKSNSSVDIECVGMYKVLEDDYYNDGSDEYLLVNSPLTLGTTEEFDLSVANDARHIAIKVTNNLSYDVPLLDYTLTVRQFSDPAGELTPFIATDIFTSGTHFGFESIVAQSTPKSFSPFFVNTISYNTKITSGNDFWVGIKTDATYWSEADPAQNNIIKLEVENKGSPGNVYKYNPTAGAWQQTNYDADVSVTARGQWDYSPGAKQEVVLEDILSEAKANTTLNFDYTLHNLSSISRNAEYLQISIDSTYKSAVEKVIQQGDSNLNPLKLYVYGGFQDNVAHVDPIDMAKPPKAIIIPKEGYDSYGIDFSEVYTKSSAVFTDTDGAKSETTTFFTNSTQVPPRRKLLSLSNVTLSEAEIIVELAASVAGEAKDNRELTLTERNIIGLGGPKYPLHRLRAGDVVAVPHRVSGIVEEVVFWTKYYIRSTSYDALTGEMRIDLSRKDDTEFLLELLGGS